MLRLRYLVLVAAMGCSPVKDSSNVPDAAIDSMDTRPPMIASSNPMNMGTKVSVLSPVSVYFDEALDPASVTAATVKLSYFANFPPPMFPSFSQTIPHGPIPASGSLSIRGEVSYDAGAKKISFVPSAPLPWGYVFTLQMDVKDTAGLPFTGAVSFTTFIDAQVKQYFFTSNGIPNSWLSYPVDMAGRQTKRLGSSAAGPDTIWFTGDDPKNQRYDYKFDPDGRIVEERYYSPGGDGQYDTADDVMSYCTRYTYDAMKRMTERSYASTPGPDGMLCTADDVPNVNSVYTYMDGTMTGYVYINSPGTDNTWRTSDDRCAVYFDYQYDASGNKTREVYKTCGNDFMPRTADDVVSFYYQYDYDATGQLARRTYAYGSGNDNMWFTADDLINDVQRSVRNADGVVTEFFQVFGPGPDAIWGTNDDPGSRTVTTLEDRLPTEITVYGSIGSDQMWGTADDGISNYQTVMYDEVGNRIEQRMFLAGPDNMWKTADDRMVQDFDFDLAH